MTRFGASQTTGGFARKPRSFALAREWPESPNRREMRPTVFVRWLMAQVAWRRRRAVLFPWRGRHVEAGLAAGCDVRCSRFAFGGRFANPISEARLVHSSFTEGAARPSPLLSMMTKCECVLMPRPMRLRTTKWSPVQGTISLYRSAVAYSKTVQQAATLREHSVPRHSLAAIGIPVFKPKAPRLAQHLRP